MQVTAVIPTYNRADLLSSLLPTLEGFSEIVVSDDGGTDDSADVARRFGARVVRSDVNLGFAATVNRGVAAATSEWVAILNNDVRLRPGWLKAFETCDADFAVGKVVTRTGAIDGTFDLLARSGCAWRAGAGREDGPLWNVKRSIRFAPMTAALFRRSLFAEVGPLDESFGSYLEDVDFGLRCALAGKRGQYVPDAVAVHEGSATLGKWSSDTVRLIARNQVLLSRKHFGGQMLWPRLVGQLLWGLVASRHGSLWAFLKGKYQGVTASTLSMKHSSAELRAVLEDCEREILTLQRDIGYDRYWRLYFWLSRR